MALAITAVALIAGGFRTIPCLNGGVDTRALWTTQCFSDIPLFYVSHGLHLDFSWFGGADPAYLSIEYPALTALFIEAMAKVTHLIVGAADPSTSPGVLGYAVAVYHAVSCLALVGVALVAARVMGAVIPRNAWTAAALVSAPLVFLEALVNWDALPVLAVACALLAARRERWGWFGVAVGVGAALKLYPVLMLGAAVAIGVRRRSARVVLVPAVAGTATWLIANAPGFLLHPERWMRFWTLNSERKADFGSLWVVARILGYAVQPSTINLTLLVGMLTVSVGVLVVTILARTEPTVGELSLVLVTAFVVLNKVYSPQYSLWLLPLVLASYGTWRWWLPWAAAEAAYFVTIWRHIVRVDIDKVHGIDKVYVLAILLRAATQSVLALGVMIRTRSRQAEVRSDGGGA
jgi:uncharacterized membrane protein